MKPLREAVCIRTDHLNFGRSQNFMKFLLRDDLSILMAKIAFIWFVVLFRQNLAKICKDSPGQRKLFIQSQF